MARAPAANTNVNQNARLLEQLERLASAVAQIEFAYPAADLGLTEVCRNALVHVSNTEGESPSTVASGGDSDAGHELQVLDAKRELGLVPRHEYRRRRKQLSRRLRSSRLAETPILQHVVGVGTVLLDGLDEGLYLLGDFAESIYRQRLEFYTLDGSALSDVREGLGDQFTRLT